MHTIYYLPGTVDGVSKCKHGYYLGRETYRSVRPAFDAKLTADLLEGGVADTELLACFFHGEVEVS